MRPTDLSMPYHDDGLVHELLTTLAMSFLLGCGATAVGLPSFIGHMAAGEPLPTRVISCCASLPRWQVFQSGMGGG